MSSARKMVKDMKVGQALNGMTVSAELKELYTGREHLLITRSTYPAHCREAFDAVGLCQLKELTAYECQQAWKAFAPCAQELHQKRVVAARMARLREHEQRKAAKGGKEQ